MREIWKDIVGYEELFQVSNEGRVRRKADGKIKKISLNGYKYPLSRLTKGGDGKSYLISHLVANAFIKNESDCRFVIHKDGDVSNNKASNLYWSKTNYKLSKRLSKSVMVFKDDGTFVGEYRSMSAASRDIGVSVSEISRCCSEDSNRESSCGYVFKLRER